MADKEQQDVADEEHDDGKSSGKKLIILGVVGMLLMGGGGAGAAYYFVSLGNASEATAGADAVAPEAPKEAIYVPLDPSFTVNFQDASRARFLQISVEAMTRDADVAALIERHMPAIRNDLVLLFSSKSSDDLASKEGKDKLREETLASVQGALPKEAGDGAVEAVYFTSFVMQ